MAHPIIRGSLDVPRSEWPGVIVRRYVVPENAFGALRLADKLILQPNAQASLEAYSGYETVVYALEGECLVEYEGLPSVRLGAGHAARASLANGARGAIRNPSAASSRALVACVVSPSADPRPFLGRGPLERDESGIGWIATHGGEGKIEASARLGESTRVGMGTIGPGVEVRFAPAVDRGLLLVVIDGAIELGAAIVKEGGDARLALEHGATLQGVVSARVAVADVPFGFVQRIG